jgi:NAD(P)-dependent dehydrogenase (short-subunit alcohol dehydrogenase family)
LPHNAFLITGANAGLGKDVARQLALCADVDSIHLACRDQAKAEAAQADLQRITGRPVFEVLIMDTADLASVRAALDAINQPLRAVLLNAGGTGGPTPMARTVDDLCVQRARSRCSVGRPTRCRFTDVDGRADGK